MKTPKQSKLYLITSVLLMFTMTLSAQWQTITNDNTWFLGSGSVGIGTTTPQTPLHIKQNLILGGVATNFISLTREEANVGGNLMYVNDFVNRESSGSGWSSASYLRGISVDASFLTPSTLRTWIKQKPADTKIEFGDMDNIFMSVSNNVGIGTTLASTKLQVSSTNSEYIPNTASFSIQKLEERYGLFSGLASTGNAWLQAGRTDNSINYDLILQARGGKVGIGTTTPISKFDVKMASNQHIQMLNDVNGAYPGAVGIVSINDANLDYTPMGFLASNYYFGNGNVGIGKLPTNIKLDVGGSASVDTEFSISGSGAVNGIGGEIHIYNSAKTGVGEMSRWSIYNMNGGYGNSLQFWAYDDHNTYNHRVTFQDDGNVGIGVPHPNFKLDVDGDMQIISNRKIGHNLNDVFTYDTDKSMGHYSLGWFADSKTIAAGPALWMSGYGGVKLFTHGLQRFAISENGKIGIGITRPDEFLATTPTEELLTVNGTIHAREVKIDLSTNLADYVFDKNYQLMPLNKVEEYVNANNHLPEIPSAAEVKNKGMNMGEMQNKLLQKVEELTLYVIEQQKQIDQLKQELKK
ncbi:MAG: hypothetical protein WCL70_12450 [Paludibacter sp.]